MKPKRQGSQNGPMGINVAVLGWELVNESEEVGFCIGMRKWGTSVESHPSISVAVRPLKGRIPS